MSITFVDGCTHYDDLLHKWGAKGGSAGMGSVNPRRSGVKYIACSGADDWVETPVVLSGTARASVGSAIILNPFPFTHAGVVLYDGTAAQLTLLWDSSTGALVLKRGGPTGTTLATSASGIVQADRWYYLEFAARIHDTLGSTEVRLNGSVIAALTLTNVDTKPGTATGIDRIRFYGSAGYCDIWVDQSADPHIFHGDCVVETIMPTGAGASADWTPSAGANYQNVDDPGAIDEDATYNSSNTEGDIDTFVCGNLPSRPTSTILAVAVNLAVRKDDTATRNILAMARIGSTNYGIGSSFNPTSDYIVHQKLRETNPADSQAWEEADVNAAEFGYQQYSIT